MSGTVGWKERDRGEEGISNQRKEGRATSTEVSLLCEEQRCINIGGYVRMRELD